MYISPNDITAFEEQDIETVLADELADSEDRYEPTSYPTAVLLAGQPGAGKTELASAMSGMLDDNAFFINADEYRRRHPNYRAIYEHCRWPSKFYRGSGGRRPGHTWFRFWATGTDTGCESVFCVR